MSTHSALFTSCCDLFDPQLIIKGNYLHKTIEFYNGKVEFIVFYLQAPCFDFLADDSNRPNFLHIICLNQYMFQLQPSKIFSSLSFHKNWEARAAGCKLSQKHKLIKWIWISLTNSYIFVFLVFWNIQNHVFTSQKKNFGPKLCFEI